MKKIFITISLFVIIFLVGLIWWNNGISPVNSLNKETVVFVVAKGAGLKEIASDLKTAGLIKDRIIFFLSARLERLEGKIQAGTFRLSQSMTAEEIAQNLTHGTLDVWITVPEGQRAEEIADTLQEKISTYNPSWRNALDSYEGYLFPDTYLIPTNADVNQIIDIMKNNFYTKIKSINLSPNDPKLTRIITIASLIEREALLNQEKPIIASVITNRLNDGMSLDIDATLQYIKGKTQGKWWSVPTIEDKKIISEYNTYRNQGLPPGPIANPGLEAIKAALNPQKTNYYFYIHDAKGNVHFATTLQEHNENIQKYGVN
jgi:UPF0755 protein